MLECFPVVQDIVSACPTKRKTQKINKCILTKMEKKNTYVVGESDERTVVGIAILRTT